jgi:heptosyltransferase-3
LQPDRILVLKLRAIGDVVLSTAVLPSLRTAFPNSEIHFLTETASVPVVQHNPNIDRVWELSLGKWAKLPAGRGVLESLRFVKTIRAQHFDLVFDLFGNPRSAFLSCISGAPRRVGFRFRGRKYAYNIRVSPRGDRVHEVEFNLDALREADITIQSPEPFFPISETDSQKIDRWIAEEGIQNGFLIGIHPWGSWPAKRWPLASFSAITDWLVTRYDARVVVLWGPGEREQAEAVVRAAQSSIHLAPQTTLSELGALLARCKLVIANDSGPMHIAAAVGTPTVGIFGPTNPKLQGPYGPKNTAAFKEGLTCLGCNRLTCPDGSCMNRLSVEEVAKVVEGVIERNYAHLSKTT